ncbi:MAG: tetratricopeptide repeat protein [Planctomycetes bacterium]|nr:tetratricopeptide repeat protein [Planctomycetota bacterium]
MSRKKKRVATGRLRTSRRARDGFQVALALHKDGKLAEAEGAYRRVLGENASHPQTLHLLGLILHRRGASSEGAKLIRRAIAVREEYSAAINDLGNVLREMRQLDEAADWFAKLVKLKPDDADAFNNLGLVLKDQEKLDDAVVSYQKAIELNPHNPGVYCNLGHAQKKLGELNEAADAYRAAIALDPQLVDALRSLAAVLRSAGRVDESREAFEQWLIQDPDNPVAQHMVATCSADRVPDRASDGYIRQVFDEYAETFDEAFGELDYRGPQLIEEAIGRVYGAADASRDILDAGCGTGLCGPCLRPFARSLVGVDLSAKMLARARKLDLYDDLVEAELTSFLRTDRRKFDLLCAADTLNYFGDLAPVFAAAHRVLRNDAAFVFTLEAEAGDRQRVDFRLNANGRYCHGLDYVKRMLVDRGFTVDGVRRATLRTEASQPVVAWVVVANKASGK